MKVSHRRLLMLFYRFAFVYQTIYTSNLYLWFNGFTDTFVCNMIIIGISVIFCARKQTKCLILSLLINMQFGYNRAIGEKKKNEFNLKHSVCSQISSCFHSNFRWASAFCSPIIVDTVISLNNDIRHWLFCRGRKRENKNDLQSILRTKRHPCICSIFRKYF